MIANLSGNYNREKLHHSVKVFCGTQLSDVYSWSDSVSNLSNKLQRESLRYKEAIQLADALGYDIQWVRRKDA